MQVSERMDTSLLREAVLSMLLASALLSGWTALCLGVDHLRRPGNHLYRDMFVLCAMLLGRCVLGLACQGSPAGGRTMEVGVGAVIAGLTMGARMKVALAALRVAGLVGVGPRGDVVVGLLWGGATVAAGLLLERDGGMTRCLPLMSDSLDVLLVVVNGAGLLLSLASLYMVRRGGRRASLDASWVGGRVALQSQGTGLEPLLTGLDGPVDDQPRGHGTQRCDEPSARELP
jgi:hypothetical protein